MSERKRKRVRKPEERKLPAWISFKMIGGKRVMYVDGYPVRDAKKPFPPFVGPTVEDIRKGHGSKDPDKCAGSCMLRRQPGVVFAAVTKDRSYIRFRGEKFTDRYQTPLSLREGVVIINDCGGKLHPMKHKGLPIVAVRATGKRQGSSAPGARDRGSKNRTPKRSRPQPMLIDVRTLTGS